MIGRQICQLTGFGGISKKRLQEKRRASPFVFAHSGGLSARLKSTLASGLGFHTKKDSGYGNRAKARATRSVISYGASKSKCSVASGIKIVSCTPRISLTKAVTSSATVSSTRRSTTRVAVALHSWVARFASQANERTVSPKTNATIREDIVRFGLLKSNSFCRVE